MITRISALFTSVLLAGCAGVSITPLSPEEAAAAHRPGASRRDGYVIYEPQVLFMATRVAAAVSPPKPAAEGGDVRPADVVRIDGWEIRRVVMPDYSRPYRVHPYAFLAKTDFDFDYQEGWMLSHQKATLDSTAVISLLTEALKKLPSFMAADTSQGQPQVVFFKLINNPPPYGTANPTDPAGGFVVQRVSVSIPE
jgi:hypothetical protein